MSESPHDAIFKNAFEFAAIGMALVDLDGRWLRVNQSLCDVVGYAKEELLAKTFQDITHPDDLGMDLSYLRQLVAGEIPNYEMEKRYIRKDGRLVWIHLYVSMVRDADGRPEFFISQIKDISKRKRAETEVARTLEEMRELVKKLNTSQAEVTKLREGLIVMCAWTKQVRHQGKWISVDQFLTERLHLTLTHGISDEAAEVVISDLEEEEDLEAKAHDAHFIDDRPSTKRYILTAPASSAPQLASELRRLLLEKPGAKIVEMFSMGPEDASVTVAFEVPMDRRRARGGELERG